MVINKNLFFIIFFYDDPTYTSLVICNGIEHYMAPRFFYQLINTFSKYFIFLLDQIYFSISLSLF